MNLDGKTRFRTNKNSAGFCEYAAASNHLLISPITPNFIVKFHAPQLGKLFGTSQALIQTVNNSPLMRRADVHRNSSACLKVSAPRPSATVGACRPPKIFGQMVR